MLTIIQSGLVVSGNSYITAARVITSGDAVSQQIVSGRKFFIGLRQGRTETIPLIGGTFTGISDYLECDIWNHGAYSNTSSAITAVRTMVDDFKITVASGAWTNPARPYLVGEEWPMPHEKTAKAKLIYRFQYLL